MTTSAAVPPESAAPAMDDGAQFLTACRMTGPSTVGNADARKTATTALPASQALAEGHFLDWCDRVRIQPCDGALTLYRAVVASDVARHYGKTPL